VIARARVRRNARPEQVYQKLRGLIVRGLLAPGQRIVETDVAARLGVSRTPVRGALQRLGQEGYIVESPRLQQSRPTVAPMTREDARELFQIVAEVEGLAARLAATLPTATRHALVSELVTINDEFRRATRPREHDHDKVWALDEAFHRKYVEAAAGPRLVALHDMVKPQAERYERLYVSLLHADLAVSAKEHAEIARAIRSGDADAAQGAVQRNWRNAADRLGAVIETVGERGSW
jgi:DNA-binding GntR family transcriptional regulator